MKKDIGTVDESLTMNNVLEEVGTKSGNRKEALGWLKDEGMGLFIHWSMDAQLGCVISHSLVGASDDYIKRYYEELPETFNPTGWDFDYIAGLARLAGFKYAVFTTKHHNGFCLWDTKSTDMNTIHTPYGRDLVAQYVEAFRRQGIRVGLYFSPEDFYYLYRNGLPVTRTPLKAFAPEVMKGYRDLLEVQMRELLSNYGKIDVMFFDGGNSMLSMQDENGESLPQMCARLAWELQPDILVTRGAIPTPEQQVPGVGSTEAWESCITLGSAWQYQPTNEQYKSGSQIIRLLVETRAKGGSLLLNIGPDANGVLCREQDGIIRELALWHFINQEAVHGVRPWVLTNEGNNWFLQAKGGEAVYVVLMDIPDWDRGVRKEFVFSSVKAAAGTKVEILGQSGELTEYRPDLDAHPYWEQKEDGLHVSVMNAQRIYCGTQWRNPLVIKITEPEEAFEPMKVMTQNELFSQDSQTVKVCGSVESLGSFDEANSAFEYRVYPGFSFATKEGGWQQAEAEKITKPGEFTSRIENLTLGVTYQYRAVVYNDRNRMYGDIFLFTIMD